MLILLLKLVGAPLFLALATLAARRWGETAGGLIAALPLVSGPISVFLAIENGAEFAAKAAPGSLAGTAALAFFGVAYARFCPRSRLAAIVAGLASFTIASIAIKSLNLTLIPLFLLTVACLIAGARFIVILPSKQIRRKPVKHDILYRMLVMAMMMATVTASAPLIGPAASGIVSTLPLMALTMALFAQASGGSAADAQQVMKGLASGLISTAVFYLVIPLLLPQGLVVGYLAAAAATIATQALVVLVLKQAK